MWQFFPRPWLSAALRAVLYGFTILSILTIVGTPNGVIVVGGGIGGLALAIALARTGRRVHVLERASAFGEIGAGLQLAPNASRALDCLGVLERVRESAVTPQRMLWLDARDAEPLTELDLGAPFRERYGYDYLVMHRSDLLAALLDAARAYTAITLETDAEVASVNGEDAAKVKYSDGRERAASLVVGADGLHSVVRRAIAGDAAPICAAYVAYRGAVPVDRLPADAVRQDAVILWTGPELHFVQYPVRRGRLYNQVAVFRSHRYDEAAVEWGTPDELDAHFAAMAPPLREALSAIDRNRHWPMYDREPLASWTRGRLTLMGDAAHPMLQYLAQGACQALEDAVALGDALAAYDDLGSALAAYETERIPRTARVQTLARAWGDYWHAAETRERDSFLRTRSHRDYRETDWFYAQQPAQPA